MKYQYLALCLCFGLFGCKSNQQTELPFFNTADFTPEWIPETSLNYKSIHTIDQFRFYNQDSVLITRDSMNGNIYVANFFFSTCPGICPTMMNNMAIVQEQFASLSDFKSLSYTVAPWIDSIPRLHNYAIDQGINPKKWYLLTGDEEAIYTLARQSFFAEKEIGMHKSVDDFLHTENFLLIDKSHRIRGVYNGTSEQDIKRLIQDIYVLINI